MQWMRAIDKTPFDILKKLAGLARNNCINEHEWNLSDILALGLDEGEVEQKRFNQHIRPAEAFEKAAGYVESMGALRALQEAMSGLYFNDF